MVGGGGGHAHTHTHTHQPEHTAGPRPAFERFRTVRQVLAVSYFYDKDYYDAPEHSHELGDLQKDKYVAGKGAGGGGTACVSLPVLVM